MSSFYGVKQSVVCLFFGDKSLAGIEFHTLMPYGLICWISSSRAMAVYIMGFMLTMVALVEK